jgi:hypothetical protein
VANSYASLSGAKKLKNFENANKFGFTKVEMIMNGILFNLFRDI